MLRRSPLVVVFALAFTLIGSTQGAWATTAPTSMVALGDSITRAYNTGPSAYADYPANSWATGSNTTVKSHAVRLGIPAARAFNDAVSGAKVADLAGQVAIANGRGAEYVTVLIGGNDVCTSSETTMTATADFRSRFETAMRSLATGSPNAKVYVLSIPDVYNLWATLKGNGSARFIWAIFGICQSMLARPTSTTQADNDRRIRVQQRNKDFNTQLLDICAAYVTYLPAEGQGTCKTDGGATFATKFAASDVSTRDYFHPSLAGQTKLANVSWTAGYSWGP
jgi:lysophospholipase L1-like esterase